MPVLRSIIRCEMYVEKFPTFSTGFPQRMGVLEKKILYFLWYDGASSSPPLLTSAWEHYKNVPFKATLICMQPAHDEESAEERYTNTQQNALGSTIKVPTKCTGEHYKSTNNKRWGAL
eukprot:1951367-Ditylum_brightwellii.AAC.1